MELIGQVKKMSEKLKIKSKSKLASILPRSSYTQPKPNPGKQPRRNSMPASRSSQPQRLSTSSPNPYFTPVANDIRTHDLSSRPRTLSTPTSVATPPTIRVRISRRPSSPSSSPVHHRRTIGLSAREQRTAQERRITTRESEQCHEELLREGIKVRDFQAELDGGWHDQLRNVVPEAVTSGLQPRDLDSEAVSGDDDEVVMRG